MKRVPRLSFGRADVRRDIDRELALHIELRTEELIAAGMSRAEARRSAEAAFGDVGAVADVCGEIRRGRDRDRRRRSVIDALRQDLRYAGRLLLRAPGFTSSALLTLTLGIGGSAAIFSVVYALLLRPLPFPASDRLVFITESNPADSKGANWGVSLPLGDDIATRARTLTAAGLYGIGFKARTTVNGESTYLPGAWLSEGALAALQVTPLVGRLPSHAEHDEHAAPVVLLSERLWERAFKRDRNVVGRSFDLGGRAHPIIGVLPRTFAFPAEDVDVWVPTMGELPPNFQNRAVHVFSMIGRLQPRVTVAEARAELQTIYRQGQQSQPNSDPGHFMVIKSMHAALVGDVRASVLILFGAVLTVLLITCGNLAGLQLARAAARAPELAVRAALGAGRFAVIRQLLIESALLGTLGCAGGVALAYVLLPWLVARYPVRLPFKESIHVNGFVLAFSAGLAIIAVLVFGLVPALHAARAGGGVASMRTARTTLDRQRHRLRSALVCAELALSLTLVVGASLVVRSFVRLQSQDPGFAPQRLLIVEISRVDRVSDDAIVGFYQRLPAQLGKLPGVLAVSAASALPISGGDSRGSLTVARHIVEPSQQPNASYRRVLPGYFRTVGIPLIAGRDFNAQDDGRDPKVVIVNRTLAVREFGSAAHALGQRIKVGPPQGEPWVTIVGVVGDVRNENMEANDEYATYEPHPQRPWRSMQLVLRTQTDPTSLVNVVRNALRHAEGEIVIGNVSTMEERISSSVAPRRFNAQLLSAFGLLALVLAALGVYGIVAFLVNERRREFGIRVALGATAREIRNLVFARALRLVLVGVVAGAGASFVLTRYLHTLLYQVKPLDPPSFFIATALLAAIVVLASLGPARRAMRADVRSALAD